MRCRCHDRSHQLEGCQASRTETGMSSVSPGTRQLSAYETSQGSANVTSPLPTADDRESLAQLRRTLPRISQLAGSDRVHRPNANLECSAWPCLTTTRPSGRTSSRRPPCGGPGIPSDARGPGGLADGQKVDLMSAIRGAARGAGSIGRRGGDPPKLVALRSKAGVALLATTVLASAVGILAASVVNVAIPAIGRDQGSGVSGLQWVLTATWSPSLRLCLCRARSLIASGADACWRPDWW